MSKVARHDTPQEIIIRKFLFSKGFRFRKNYKKLPGSPDIVLPKYKTVIFVHGCFWHGHSCKAGKLPKSNEEFWINKIKANKKRDRQKNKKLIYLGWKVIEVWQCQIRTKPRQEEILKDLIKKIRI